MDDRNEADWKTLFLSSVELHGGNYIWQIKNKTPPFFKKLNPFWKDVYNSWMQCTIPGDNAEPQGETLFYNPNIQINNKSVFYYDWYLRGISLMNDILDENGNFYSWEQFSQNYGIENQIFRYNAFLHAIPKNWKQRISESHKKLITVICPYIQKLKNLKKPCKEFYQNLVKKTAKTPIKAQTKWEACIGEIITDNQWEKIFLLPIQITKETKLRSFQFTEL